MDHEQLIGKGEEMTSRNMICGNIQTSVWKERGEIIN